MMKGDKSLKLFISYTHNDVIHIEKFRKHMAPLKTNGLISDWYDRKINAGDEFQEIINNNLNDADIICLFISAEFLASKACNDEKRKALKLKKEKGTLIIPIILSPCGWLDDKDISVLLALPTDGKPISDFTNLDSGWKNVYDGIKQALEREIKMKNLQISDSFMKFLNDVELLTRAHANKTEVVLDDIFIYPELNKYDELKEYEKKVNAEHLVSDLSECSKILIAGENQSGKTTLCKKIFIELRKKNFIPLYIADKENLFHGTMENKIANALKEQYNSASMDDIDQKRLVPIIDDFHYAKNKEKHIIDLSCYCYQIVIVDDIFNLYFKDESLIKDFNQFKIKQLSPTLRNELIKKWIALSDKHITINHNNQFYKEVDDKTELVNSILGKIISSGIMPAYPFFILTIISTYETFEKPLDQEITSQGYCYQALIYIYLRKHGVKNDEIDTYINFLTVLSYHFYKYKKNVLSIDEFDDFMVEYQDKYNLTIKKETLLGNLNKTNLLIQDSCGNYSFYYPYLFYYFVAKYLFEHLNDNKEEFSRIINNLHKDENAYITVFMSHHSKSSIILDEILVNSMCLFDKYSPATLTKDELEFFDDNIDTIVNAVLPGNDSSSEKVRSKLLSNQDEIEENDEENKLNKAKEEEQDPLERDLRKSIKTVEVMGQIIKNRAGSLEKERLVSVFEEAMNLHLRVLSSFFSLIKEENHQKEIIDYIENRLNHIISEKTRKPNKDKLKDISIEIFWKINFVVIYGFINKIVHSLGSDKLLNVIRKVCDSKNTPATFLVKHGILMWYGKNLQIDNISDRIEKDGFSETAKRVIRFMIVQHCTMHKVDFKDKQKIEKKLGIPTKTLIQKSKET